MVASDTVILKSKNARRKRNNNSHQVHLTMHAKDKLSSDTSHLPLVASQTEARRCTLAQDHALRHLAQLQVSVARSEKM